ncbi:fumarylacetoacetate hydrolase family protein [Sporobolomyces koalae]|uniref:fumarylacetoacetate hydrolase family protein n=1 Tax=Sporobolomyces koalae TaxID=500713 RepID=UPI00316F95E9
MTWNKLIRFIANEDGQTYYGDCITPGDIGKLYSRNERIEAIVLSRTPADARSPLSLKLSAGDSSDARILTVRKLLSPLSREDVTAIRGLGLQYAPPGVTAANAPDVLCLFLKPTTTVAGPEDDIVIPESARDEKNDYEVELCVVIGDEDVPPNTTAEEAMNFVAGFCVVNDVSSRGLCGKGGAGQWGVGKNYNSWCPIGPCIVRPSSLMNPHSLEFTTKLNGKLVQRGNTANLLVPVPELIARLSVGSTLSRHSLILTGSPIALGRQAATDTSEESPFLSDRDRVECWIEGIGTLVNTVRQENDPRGIVRPYKAKL